MLFKVEANKPVLESNPELNAIPEFVDCTDRELRYVLLMHDYDTPFRDLPFEERQEQVLLTAGFKKEPSGKRFDRNAREVIAGKSDRVEQAIGKFKAMQYDDEKEMLKDIDSHISQVRAFIRSDKKGDAKDLEYASKMQLDFAKLLAQRKAVVELLSIRDEVIEQEDQEEEITTKSLSTLDRINQIKENEGI